MFISGILKFSCMVYFNGTNAAYCFKIMLRETKCRIYKMMDPPPRPNLGFPHPHCGSQLLVRSPPPPPPAPTEKIRMFHAIRMVLYSKNMADFLLLMDRRDFFALSSFQKSVQITYGNCKYNIVSPRADLEIINS
jgi:hypothetical protein